MTFDIDYDEPQVFRCVGGPWNGQLILLGDDEATMVFRLGDARGRYTTHESNDKRSPARIEAYDEATPCRWQDVPLQVAS
jgi:hypothetical protein